MPRKKRQHPGITVYPRGSKWAYRLELESDSVTGDRDRENRSGFDSYDEAWEAALASKAIHDRGRKVKPAQRKVEEFFAEWLVVQESAVKPSSHQYYVDYVNYYVNPQLGRRKLQDITVPVLNELYRRLLSNGRIKQDTNWLMYQYWAKHQHERDGLGPKPQAIAKAAGTSIYAARSAAMRYRRGRVPERKTPGLAPKTVKNLHRMLHRAFEDAVAWDYIVNNPAEHASVPRQKRTSRRQAKAMWTVDELAAWLDVAMRDRFSGMWLLAATTGMRRSELAGVGREMLDLDNGLLAIDDTRIVIAGRADDSDGKTEASERQISLDPFTVEALRDYLDKLDEERRAFGSAYPDHGKLMCWSDGKLMHPETITRTFNRLVDRAGVRRIRLHDVRHTYSTLSLDHGIDPKIISDRIGHSDVSVLFQVYAHRSTGKDREAAESLASLMQEALKRRRGQP